MNSKKVILLTIAALAVGLFFCFDLGRFLTLEALKSNRQALLDYYTAHTLAMVAGFMAIYIIQTTLSLPGAAILSLAAGAIFGSILVRFTLSSPLPSALHWLFWSPATCCGILC